MYINKDSWHYKLVIMVGLWPKKNLCPYMRQIVGAACILFLMFIMVLFIALWLSWPILQFFTLSSILFSVLSGFIYLGLGHFLLSWVKEYTRYKTFWLKPKSPEINEKEARLLTLWLRAKHDKVCPKIEFK